jgi:hypothetical protein
VRRSVRIAFVAFLCNAAGVEAATLHVNTLGDSTLAGDGLVSLREAMLAAAVDGTTDLGEAASGADRIALGALGGTLTLQSTLPVVGTPIAIDGPGAANLTLTTTAVSGAPPRLFVVDGGSLEINGLRMTQGSATGQPGGDCAPTTGCGGGSAAIGGIALLNAGLLVMRQCEIDNGAAVGGAGGARSLAGGSLGGGGGAGLAQAGAAPTTADGGSGGAGAPLAGSGGGSGQAGGDGAGGGGGSAVAMASSGGIGGFGGGGGGGGRRIEAGASAPAGDGGYGAGGGGRGGGGSGGDGPGGTSPGAFGGNGGASTGNGALGGAGGGGAGLGGGVFARAGALELQEVLFSNCLAIGGSPGAGTGIGNRGQPGRGKGAAIFVHPDAQAIASGLQFSNSFSGDATGTGYTPGVLSDTEDVYGIIRSALFADGFEAP